MSLAENRKKLKGKIDSLVLCKGELFYMTFDKKLETSIYPVSQEQAEKEAKFFKVSWVEQ